MSALKFSEKIMIDENTTFEEKEVDTDNIKCPSCGSNLEFSPQTQTLVCPHCGYKEAFSNDAVAEELSIESAFANAEQWNDDSVVFGCENCGAKVVLDKSETAKCCPFCGTAHVVKLEELSGIKPNAVLPFKLALNQAAERCKAWAKKKIFAPKAFKKTLSPENVKGVYAPCFTFDSKTESKYVGRIGVTHTRTVGSGKNKRVETYTVWKRISGRYSYDFDDVTVFAGDKIPQERLRKLAPFDTNNSKKYESEYLLGFMAYRYEKDIKTSWGDAKKEMDKRLRNLILSQYHYDKVDFLDVSTSHSDVTYKYVMLPVYVGNYKFKKKSYSFYVNGHTGKVTGKSPVSIIKVALTAVVSAVVLGAIVWLLNTYA